MKNERDKLYNLMYTHNGLIYHIELDYKTEKEGKEHLKAISETGKIVQGLPETFEGDQVVDFSGIDMKGLKN